jgi:hypothetical protein
VRPSNLIVSVLIVMLAGIAWAGIKGSKHDLSATTGPGPIKAVSETQICVFCHTPHAANPAVPLWNHSLSSATYQVPSSSDPQWTNLLSTVGQPDGDSKLCLSCHDGTVAIGALVNMPGPGLEGTVQMQGVGAGGEMPSTAYGYIGTNLKTTHPVSIAVNQALKNDKDAQCASGNVTYTITLNPTPPVRLRPTGAQYANQPGITCDYNSNYNCGVQCTSCHDPHLGNSPDFLLTGTADNTTKGHPGTWSVLCDSCHPPCP